MLDFCRSSEIVELRKIDCSFDNLTNTNEQEQAEQVSIFGIHTESLFTNLAENNFVVKISMFIFAITYHKNIPYININMNDRKRL